MLRERDFARLFAVRFTSSFGSAMAPIAMAFAVLERTGAPELVGVVLASQTGAQVCMQMFGGALADRWSRKRVIVGAELVAATSQACMAFLLISGTGAIWQMSLLMAVGGVCFAMIFPAEVGIVPLVVERERLQPANALLQLSWSGAFALGGATAGVVVATAGSGWAIAANSATFLASAGLMAGLRPRPQTHAEPSSLWRELRDGWREFTSHRWLWTIVVQFSLLMAGWSGGFLVVGPYVAEQSLGGPVAWGWVAAAFGAGLVAGGVVGIRLRVRRPMWVATLCVLGHALPLLLLVGPAPVALLVAGAFAAGVGGQLFGVLWYTALHTKVAPEALSRVSAYDILGSMALAPLGEAAAGSLVAALGAPATLWIAATLVIVPTLAVLGVREVRTLES